MEEKSMAYNILNPGVFNMVTTNPMGTTKHQNVTVWKKCAVSVKTHPIPKISFKK